MASTKKLFLASICCLLIFSCSSATKQENNLSKAELSQEQEVVPEIQESVQEEEIFQDVEIIPLEFKETWGYVMQGREKEWNTHLPITDVGYFIGAVNTMSEIPSDIPKRAKFFSSYKGRVHLVSSVDSKSQTHLLLDPELPLRKRIITQLVEASKTYDGLQIDWELVPADDKENFLAFLKKLREQLGKKTLSVAIPARMRPLLRKDPYAYSDLVPLVDKIIVMAYDEHWSTSAPGAIASTDWCKKIADYSLSVIPSQKLVMGVSFYGRTWSNDSVGNRAWYNSGVERIKRENGVAEVKRDSYGVPHFTFTKTVKITGWYDDVQSLNRRCKMYKDSGVSNLAFWRIGQEDPAFWEQITLK